MNKKKNRIGMVALVLIFFLLAAASAFSADDEETTVLKIKLIDVINSERAAHGLKPVWLDDLASRVATAAAKEAAEQNYLSSWNLQGETPYHRYAFAGGKHHVMENTYQLNRKFRLSKSIKKVLGYLLDAHYSMYNETPPNDGHRKNILNPWHTHVGIGYWIEGKELRYYEEYVNKYLEFQQVDTFVRAGDEARVSGKILNTGYGFYMAIVYYEPLPRPMSRQELMKTGPYKDFTGTVAIKLPFWHVDADAKTGEFSFSFKTAREGLYYVQIFIKEGHTGNEDKSVNTKGLSPVSGIVVKALTQ